MNKQLRALMERKQKALAAAKAITAQAESEKRELTDEERTQFDAHATQIETLNGDISRQQALIAAEASMAGVDLNTPITGGAPAAEQDPRRGFRSFGEFAAVVRTAGQPGGMGVQDERLRMMAAAPSTYGNESVGADGGYLVPPEFAQSIYTHSLENDSLLPLTDNNPVSGNGMTFPKDETTPWGSDGIRAYWEAEAAVATATKPKLGISQQRLHKLFALVPVTDELMADALTLTGYLERKMGESIRWKSNDALFNGTGAGQPLGILQAPAKVSVAKEGSQTADTIVVQNVAKMFARMLTSSLRNSVWMINSDALPQIITMVLNNYPIYMAPGGLPNAPAGTLLGRPIMLSDHCKTVGDQGDIALVDWKQYRTITKRTGIEMATSMHLYFDAGATAFRATFRIDGAPSFSSPVTPANGSNTRSAFVFLDERA